MENSNINQPSPEVTSPPDHPRTAHYAIILCNIGYLILLFMFSLPFAIYKDGGDNVTTNDLMAFGLAFFWPIIIALITLGCCLIYFGLRDIHRLPKPMHARYYLYSLIGPFLLTCLATLYFAL